MAELVLTDLDKAILSNLQERATRHGRTPAEEAKVILTEAVREQHAYDWSAVDSLYERMAASGQAFSDSADLLREDRDR